MDSRNDLHKPDSQPAPAAPLTPRRLHPLVATAAAAVIVACAAATAAITGVLPFGNSRAQEASTGPVVAAAPTPAPGTPTPAADTAPPSPQAAPNPPPQLAQNAPPPSPSPQYGQPPQPPAPSPACANCGTVEAISAIRHEGHGTGIGAVGGAVAGGLIGNQFGGGLGRLGMTALGAAGGGYAGNSVEKHLRSTTTYSVRVRMSNGHTRYFSYRSAPPLQQGEPVRVEHGTLVAAG